MEFPITDLLGDEQSERWLLEHFHPDGLKCPKCGAGVENSLKFRLARKSSLQVYRCRDCQAVYNFYTGTLFERRRFRPQQAVLLIRGVLKGEPANVTAAELELDYISVLQLRRAIQEQAKTQQSEQPLPDSEAESDELFQNAGKKGVEHFDPLHPPRRRANKRRGRGAYENDRPPVMGVIGRGSGQVRLRVVKDTQAATLEEHVHRFTRPDCHVYTDEYDSYNGIERQRSKVAHGKKEWARDDDGDGIREVHTNTAEGMWTGLRNFLRPFRGVSKCYLDGYIAVYECQVNLRRISPALISALVKVHLTIVEP